MPVESLSVIFVANEWLLLNSDREFLRVSSGVGD